MLRTLMLITSVAACGAAATAQPRPRPALPASLERMFSARSELRTGDVYWSRDSRKLPHHGERFFRSRLSPHESTVEALGDAEGVMVRTENGAPAFIDKAHRTLEMDGGAFLYTEGALSAELWDGFVAGGPRQAQLRTLGAGYSMSSFMINSIEQLSNEVSTNALRVQERREGEQFVVTADLPEGRVEWWIDPKRGFNATRVALTQNGVVALESRTTLAEFDGVWYPTQVEYFEASHKAGLEPIETIRVHSGAFNAREQPQRLTPDLIGVETGVPIARHTGIPPVRADTVYWDGNVVIGEAEYKARLKGGELKPGPTISRIWSEAAQATAAPAGTPAPTATSPKDSAVPPERLWEAHTRISSSGTSSTRSSAPAMSVLREAQRPAYAYLFAKRPELEALERREAAAASIAEETRRAQERADVAARRSDLLRPIEQIFEDRLKPGLERLLTRRQRASTQAAR